MRRPVSEAELHTRRDGAELRHEKVAIRSEADIFCRRQGFAAFPVGGNLFVGRSGGRSHPQLAVKFELTGIFLFDRFRKAATRDNSAPAGKLRRIGRTPATGMAARAAPIVCGPGGCSTPTGAGNRAPRLGPTSQADSMTYLYLHTSMGSTDGR
jgi:hypothetical protein